MVVPRGLPRRRGLFDALPSGVVLLMPPPISAGPGAHDFLNLKLIWDLTLA